MKFLRRKIAMSSAERMRKAVIENNQLDDLLLETGQVNVELYDRLIDAERYAAASTVGWVIRRLLVLEQRLKDGKSLTVFDKKYGEDFTIEKPSEFKAWVLENFPSASHTINEL